ncbi:MAG: asparagine synthase C-terminal domain-containing protein [Gemmatimonadaceae bacterium]
MNVVFGRAGAGSVDLAEVGERLRHTYGSPVMWGPSELTLTVGALSDGGTILGRARRGALSLTCIGSVHAPLPGFTAGSPLDDPDATAAFLLERYVRAGRAFLGDVQGHYAVAIADAERDLLLLAVGPGSLRNIIYGEYDGSLVFGTNLFSFVSALGGRAQVDRSLEDFLLIYGFLPLGRVPFAGARMLAAGTLLEWCDGRATVSTIEAIDPWAATLPRLDASMTFDQGVERLYDVFMGAMEDLSASRPDAAVMLGGFDSGLVAAGLARVGKRVTTYTFGYGDPKFDQAHTDTLAAHVGNRHEWVQIGPADFREGMEQYARRYSAASNWPNYIIQSDLVTARMRRDGFGHCYTGDGCDHTFMGYPRVYGRAQLYEAFGRLSPAVSRAAIGMLSPRVLEHTLGHPWRVALNVLRTMGGEKPAGRFLTFRIFDELSLSRLRGDAPPQERTPAEILRDMTRGLEHLSAARLAYMGKTIIGTNRTKIIGCSDGNGVSILSPYLHPAVKAFALGIPDAFVRPPGKSTLAGSGKYILMEMAERKGLLPGAFIHQKKVAAVDAPIDAWYYGPLREFIRAQLTTLPFATRPAYIDNLLRPKWAESLYREHVSSDHLTTHGVSLLATYASLAALAGPRPRA